MRAEPHHDFGPAPLILATLVRVAVVSGGGVPTRAKPLAMSSLSVTTTGRPCQPWGGAVARNFVAVRCGPKGVAGAIFDPVARACATSVLALASTNEEPVIVEALRHGDTGKEDIANSRCLIGPFQGASQ